MNYTAEVVKEKRRHIRVRYSSPGYEDVEIPIPLREGVDVDELIAAHSKAAMRIWLGALPHFRIPPRGER